MSPTDRQTQAMYGQYRSQLLELCTQLLSLVLKPETEDLRALSDVKRELQEVERGLVAILKTNHVTWAALGGALGTQRQLAHRRLDGPSTHWLHVAHNADPRREVEHLRTAVVTAQGMLQAIEHCSYSELTGPGV